MGFVGTYEPWKFDEKRVGWMMLWKYGRTDIYDEFLIGLKVMCDGDNALRSHDFLKNKRSKSGGIQNSLNKTKTKLENTVVKGCPNSISQSTNHRLLF
jgi:hypothetical protein